MVRWRNGNVHPFSQFRGEVDRLVGDLLGSATAAAPRAWAAVRAFPAANVWEEAEQLFAEAELPGLKTEDVDVSVSGDELTIRGRRQEASPETAQFHRRERGVGEFSRTLRLPYDVDAERVEATLRDGVLLIKLPKAESARARKVEVKTGG
jgi:HSP20 family protein